MCVGAHIPSPQDRAFTRATATLDELYYLTSDQRFCPPQWCKIEGVEHPGETQSDGTRLTPYIFPVIGGYRAEHAQGGTTEAHYSVATTATSPWLSEATEKWPDLKLQMMTTDLRRGKIVTLHVGAHVAIRLPDNIPGSVAGFNDRMAPIEDLVRLATFDACGVEQITLSGDNDLEISLLVHAGNVARPDDVHDAASVVFTLDDVPLAEFLKMRQRLTAANQAKYAWDVTVGLCGYTSRIVEEYVSQTLAAAEGFHCWCLEGGEGISLNSRLKALHDKLAPDVQAVIGLDTEHWASWAVWARNHVAHGGTKRWRSLEDNFQLHIIGESVHLVTYLVALQELGVPRDKIVEALRIHPRLQVRVQRSSGVNSLSAAPPPGDSAGNTKQS